MLNKKTIGVALACALALGAWSGSTLATTVGGVTWDESSVLDLQIETINLRETSIANVGDLLTGYGKVGSINGSTEVALCPSCDLTFTFRYTVKDIDNTDLTSPKIVFDQGFLDFFVDDNETFDVTKPDTAGIGSLWLSLEGHEFAFSGFSTTGDLYSNVTGPVSDPRAGSGGFGLLDVTGGPASFWTDTNSQDDGADFFLNSSFQVDGVEVCGLGDNALCYPIAGQGGLKGATLTVPEPGAAGLLGLGLGLLGFLTWKRSKESNEQA